MYTLKKNKVVEVTPPIIPQEHCHEEFVNQDFYGFVVVQTVKERDKIPLKLRQNGMIATVVEEGFIQYQLQTNSKTGISDNNNWLRINKGGQLYDGDNLFIFSTQEILDKYLNEVTAREGQLVYSVADSKYFVIDKNKNLADPFPNKFELPTEYKTNDKLVYQIPVYLDGQSYWRTSDDFGKVSSVNGLPADENKNVQINIDSVFKAGGPVTEDSFDSVVSNKRVLLYDPNTLKTYWKDLANVGKINTVDNIGPVKGNVDLSGKYYDKTQIKSGFVGMPNTASSNQDFKVVLLDSTNKSYHIKLGDIPNLKEYTSPDESIVIDGNAIYFNIADTRYDTEMIFQENMLPLTVTIDQEYKALLSVILNGRELNSEMYRSIAKDQVVILENAMEIFDNIPKKLYITTKGVKLLS